MASEFLQQLVEEREKERKKVLASDPAYKEILEEELKKEEAIAKKTTNVSSGTKSTTFSNSKDESSSTVMPHIKQGWSDETYKLLNRERPKNIGGADIDAELYGTGFIAGVQGGGQGVARGINATQDTIDRYVAAHDEKPLLGTANKIGWSDDTYRFLGMEKPKNITENPKIFEETKSQKEYQEKMENATGVNKFLGQVAYGAGNMIPSMAVSTINPALGLATMGLQGFGDAYDQAIEEGKSENEALAYGVLTGATNILTQKLLGGINIFGKNMISKTAGKQLNQLVSRLSKNPTVQKAFAQAGNMASEGIEEYIQAVLDPVFRNITFDENNAIDPLSMDKIEQGLLGMATSGVLNAGTSVARRTMAGIPRRSYTPAQQQTIDMLNQAGANIPVESDSFMPEQDSISSQQPIASLSERNRQPASDQQILDDFNQWRKDNFGGAFGRISDADMQALKDLYEEETGIHLDRALVEPEQKKDYGVNVTADNVSLPPAYHNLFSDSTITQTDTNNNSIDSHLQTEDILQTAEEVGLGGISEADVKRVLGEIDAETENLPADTGFLEDLARRTGAKVRIGEITAEDGRVLDAGVAYYDPAQDTLVFAPNSTRPQIVRGIAMHELAHVLQRPDAQGQRTKEYQAYESLVLEQLGQDLDAQITKKQVDYLKHGQALSRQGAIDELVADYTRDTLFNDPVAIRRLVKEQRNVAQRIYDFLVDAINRLRGTLGNAELAELYRGRDLFQTALEGRRTAGEGDGQKQYYLNPKFEKAYDNWVSKHGRSKDMRLFVGKTSNALKSIGVKDQPIMWDTSKINKILEKHPNINDNILKQVPNVLENPIIIMESKNKNSRITMFGEVYDTNGLPVLAVLELEPNNKSNTVVLDQIRIASVYSKNRQTNPEDIKATQNFIDSSKILYIDPNKNRTDSWLVSNRLQLPFDITSYGSINRVAYGNAPVNTSISNSATDSAGEKQKKDYGVNVTADNVSLPLAYHNLFSNSGIPQSSTDGNTIVDEGLPNYEKNRIDSKLVSNRLQLPLDKSYHDPTNMVAYEDETVNTDISDSNINNSGKRQYSLTDEEIELLKNAVLQKRRGFVSNTLPKAEAAGVPGMAEVRAAMSPESQYYTPESMAETQERGRELVSLYGSADRTKDVLINKMNRGAGLNSQEVAAVVELVKHFGRQGTPEGEEAAAAIAEAYAPASTDIARAMNIMKIFQQETPAGFLILADRFIQKAKTGGKDVTLTPQDKADLLSLGQVVNEWENLSRLDALTRWSKMQDILEPASDKVKRWMREAQDVERQQGPANFDMAGAVTAKAMDIIANKMPSTAREKFRALQRISMLSNPKTHIRNIGGNALVAAGETMAHPISWLADQGLSRITGQKTHAAIKPQEVFQGIVKGVQRANAQRKLDVDLSADNKYSENSGFYRPKAFNPELGKNWLSKRALQALDTLDNAVSTLLNYGDAPFLWGYYEDALGQIMRANKVSEATPEMTEAAMQSALRRVFQDENKVTKMMQGIRNAVPFIGDIIAPYVKTPTNVTKIGLEYTPIGIAEGMLKAFVGENSLRSLQKKGIDTTSLQRHCAELIGRGSIGTVFMVLGMALRAANIGTGDEEENRNQNAFNRAIGKLPNSFKIGDTYYDLSSLQSAAVPLIAGSAIDSALTTKEKGTDYWLSLIRNIAAGTMQAGNTVTDMPVLQGVQELLGGSYTEKGPGQIFLDTLTEIPTQVVPLGSLMRQIATAMDPYARDRSSDNYLEDKLINPLKAMTPGLSDDFPVRYDTLGNPQKTYEADTEAGRLFNIFLNPLNTAKDKSTPVSDEIERVFESSGNQAVFPKLAPSNVSDNKISYDVDAAARQEWNKTQGGALSEILSNLMQSEDYRNASTEEQVEMMIKATDYARENAKQGFLHRQGVNYQSSIVGDIDGAAELGINPGQYLAIKMRHETIPDEYDDKRAQATVFSRYLDDLELSPEQREYIDNTLGYWGSYRIQPDAYRLGLMSQSAQSRWPVAQNLGMSEENFVYYYPMCSTSGGRKKADCIRDLQNAGMTPQQAQIFWDVVKTKKYDSKVN